MIQDLRILSSYVHLDDFEFRSSNSIEWNIYFKLKYFQNAYVVYLYICINVL